MESQGPKGALQAPADGLANVRTEAERELAETEARLCGLLERATALASRAEQERAQLQRFLEEFALEQAVYDLPQLADGGGSGPLIDVAALRQGAQDLAEELTRSSALRGNLETTVRVVRSCQEQLAAGAAFRPTRGADEIAVQQAMNAAREDERRRLAREVHDGPAQVLANAIFAIDLAEQMARRRPEQLPEELARVRGLLKDGVAEVRRFMFDLRPTMLEDRGLAPTLRHFVVEYNRFFDMDVRLEIAEPLPGLTKDQDLTIFRIAQEALQNIRKHAKTRGGRIGLGCPGGTRLELLVADGGKGFDAEALVPRPGTGAGLPGMRERAKLIGAELTVTSALGEGTELLLSLPVRRATGPLAAAALGTGGQG